MGSQTAQTELGQMTGAQKELQSIAERIAAMNRAAASSRQSSADRTLAQKLGLINQITGLAAGTGGEIPYAGVEAGALGGRTNADLGYLGSMAQTQQKGPSIWDKLLGAGGAAAGSLAGLGWKPFGGG